VKLVAILEACRHKAVASNGGNNMGREIRRRDRAISENEARSILEKGEFGVLSTVSSEGQPYGVPISYCYTGDVIYFHCAIEGHKLENLRANNRVSFCVVGKTELLPEKFATTYESAIVFGKAFELTGDEKHTGLLEIVKKYSPGFINEGLQYIKNAFDKAKVYKVVIESFTGKSRK
jgi:nitroimidazol reductase NimA-like FMN-containing flavoprotein (pyridoxamine 5'-phosphate oxidase superfamily)